MTLPGSPHRAVEPLRDAITPRGRPHQPRPVTALSGAHRGHYDSDHRDSETEPADYCLTCLGDGYIEDMYGPGTYHARDEVWLPSPDIYPCDACRGTGRAQQQQALPTDDHLDIETPDPATPSELNLDEPDLPF